jgi:hypothetical protein
MSQKHKIIVFIVAAVLILGGAGWIIYRNSTGAGTALVGGKVVPALKVTQQQIHLNPNPTTYSNGQGYAEVFQEIFFNRELLPGETFTVRIEMPDESLADGSLMPYYGSNGCLDIGQNSFDCTFTANNVPKAVQMGYDLNLKFATDTPEQQLTLNGSGRGSGATAYPYLATLFIQAQ